MLGSAAAAGNSEKEAEAEEAVGSRVGIGSACLDALLDVDRREAVGGRAGSFFSVLVLVAAFDAEAAAEEEVVAVALNLDSNTRFVSLERIK